MPSDESDGGALNFDILRIERSGDGTVSEPEVFLGDPFETVNAVISPDGRYIAYSSRVSGSRDTRNWDVFVQPFPAGGAQVQITPGGGNQVRWNPNGKELFFVSEDALFSVEVSTESEFRAGKPRELFRHDGLRSPFARAQFDVGPDGERFLVVASFPIER